jgi:PPOX class probable F420-dependent enzyme
VVPVTLPDGTPQLTVVWYLWDGKTFRFSTTTNRAKYVNIKRNPRISLLVDDFDNKRHVVAYGHAEITNQDRDFSRLLFQKYLPDDPRAREGDDDPDRVVITLHPERILTGS